MLFSIHCKEVDEGLGSLRKVREAGGFLGFKKLLERAPKPLRDLRMKKTAVSELWRAYDEIRKRIPTGVSHR
ncbi:MAG: hypothetical protein DRP38_06205 [Thermotogae bacterium]|nr:MAG: hypothetical protein DRP38_06205 [Thermotogota bacterium]